MRTWFVIGALLALPLCIVANQPAQPAQATLPTKEQNLASLQALMSKVNPANVGKPTTKERLQDSLKITNKLVKGTYVVESLTNSDDVPICCGTGELSKVQVLAQSIATIFKLHLNGNGTGNIPFLAATVSFGTTGETFVFHDIPVTYHFDQNVNGVATLNLADFPFLGTQLNLYVIFKVRDGEVVGFDMLSNNNVVTGLDFFYLWFLGEGVKNTKAEVTSSSSCSSR